MKIKDILPEYFRFMRVIGRSKRTVLNARYDLNQFIRFINTEGIIDLEDLTADIMSEYQQELSFRITAKGTLLTIRSQTQLLGTVKVFTRYLKEEDYLIFDPGTKIRLPKKPRRLPKVILTQKEIKKLISACGKTNRGFRNRVVIEILYDTAIRRAELRDMKIQDIDLESGYAHVTGKGNKDRVVPVSKQVCELIKHYILMVRPTFLQNTRDSDHLILNRWGDGMTGCSIRAVVKRCCVLAKLKKNITTHTFRHTCVTHMLRNGAPIRHLQQMLGHESLESTQIYTHVTINDLKEIHAKYHPSGSTDI